MHNAHSTAQQITVEAIERRKKIKFNLMYTFVQFITIAYGFDLVWFDRFGYGLEFQNIVI